MNHEHVNLLKSSVTDWNTYRRENLAVVPDLKSANLRRADLRYADLRYADLTDANLRGADLTDTDLRHVDLRDADLTDANLRGADLTGADLTDADLTDADFEGADLRDADLRDADLTGADLTGANLRRANLHRVTMNWQSHALIGERLRQLAISDIEHIDYFLQLGLAGAISQNTQHCYKDWLSSSFPDSIKTWALEAMRTWVRDGDNVPSEIMVKESE